MNQGSAIVGFDHEGVRQFTGPQRLQWEIFCVSINTINIIYNTVKLKTSHDETITYHRVLKKFTQRYVNSNNTDQRLKRRTNKKLSVLRL